MKFRLFQSSISVLGISSLRHTNHTMKYYRFLLPRLNIATSMNVKIHSLLQLCAVYIYIREMRKLLFLVGLRVGGLIPTFTPFNNSTVTANIFLVSCPVLAVLLLLFFPFLLLLSSQAHPSILAHKPTDLVALVGKPDSVRHGFPRHHHQHSCAGSPMTSNSIFRNYIRVDQ